MVCITMPKVFTITGAKSKLPAQTMKSARLLLEGEYPGKFLYKICSAIW